MFKCLFKSNHTFPDAAPCYKTFGCIFHTFLRTPPPYRFPSVTNPQLNYDH